MRTDEELIALYFNGDEGAFSQLVERHLKSIYGFALRFVQDRNDAEDIAQESFLKVWKNLKAYAGHKGRFKTWLMRIVRNTAIDHLRKRKDFLFSMLEDDDESNFMDRIADDSALPDEIVAHKDDVAALEAALRELSIPHREILMLYNGNDFSFEEIATIQNTSVNTVKSRYRRAVQALRDLLKPI